MGIREKPQRLTAHFFGLATAGHDRRFRLNASQAARGQQRSHNAMKIHAHPESHIVELDDGSQWQIFLGDLDETLNWKPETDLRLIDIDDEVASRALFSPVDQSRVRVLPVGQSWPVKDVKAILREG
jgi:hypothetical protein